MFYGISFMIHQATSPGIEPKAQPHPIITMMHSSISIHRHPLHHQSHTPVSAQQKTDAPDYHGESTLPISSPSICRLTHSYYGYFSVSYFLVILESTIRLSPTNNQSPMNRLTLSFTPEVCLQQPLPPSTSCNSSLLR